MEALFITLMSLVLVLTAWVSLVVLYRLFRTEN